MATIISVSLFIITIISLAALLSFSDKIISRLFPGGDVAKLSDEAESFLADPVAMQNSVE